MEFLFPVEQILWVASLLAEALLVLRLARERLVRRFPLFAAFLIVDVACGVALMQIDIKSRAYAEAFRICTSIMFVFRVGVAAELYERICEHFPGIGTFRIVMAAVLVLLAGLVAMFTFRPNLANQWAFPQTVVMVVQRFQSEILAAALVLTWIFLRFVLSIRQPFRPNVWTHWSIATIYFGVSGAAYWAGLLTGGGLALLPINTVMLATHLVCFLAWIRFMQRAGEELPAFSRLSPDQVQAVESYNRDLLRAVRSLPDQISARQAENRDIPVHRARPL